ncbi:MAG: hypothetical protein CMN25_17820 [Salinicola sp.]|nr:hypothetical protein [Salinicola sp.]
MDAVGRIEQVGTGAHGTGVIGLNVARDTENLFVHRMPVRPYAGKAAGNFQKSCVCTVGFVQPENAAFEAGQFLAVDDGNERFDLVAVANAERGVFRRWFCVRPADDEDEAAVLRCQNAAGHAEHSEAVC